MAILIGTDEAGYGPNLGPLVIAATCWRLPDELLLDDLYEVLADAVACEARSSPDDSPRLVLADSKLVYKPKGTLAGLEEGVHAAGSVLGHKVSDWRSAWKTLCFENSSPGGDTLSRSPWYRDFNCPLPLDADENQIEALATQLGQVCQSAQVELVVQRAVAIFPQAFNQQVDRLGSKGALLTQATLQLARSLVPESLSEPVLISCDKHGGRNKYAAAIQESFDDAWVQVLTESRAESRYQLNHQGQEVELRFRVGGEAFLPSALASMIAKYLRELAMKAFNHFWTSRIPGIRPTAGYPQDAKRFRQEAAEAISQLDLQEHHFWRSR